MIIWDDKKALKLKIERNISFEDISEIILNKQYIEILEHPAKKNQNIFIVEINDYIHAVPFIVDKDSNIVIKTVYPSRKLQRKYSGGKKCKKK